MQFLNMYTVGTKSNDINANNLEFYWYGVWNIVLGYWFQPRFLVVPQYMISYELVNRDDNTICKCVKPDFVVTKYSYENDTFSEHIQLIVEIKRSSNNPKKDFKSISKQLDKQITTLFTKGKYEHMYGIITVGQCWKLYKYNFVKTNTHKRTWSNTSYTNKDHIENFEVVEESGILNISSKDYYNDFNELMRSLNQIP